MKITKEQESILLSYLRVVSFLKNSDALYNISTETEDTEDAYKLLYKPVCRLSSVYKKCQDGNIVFDESVIENVKRDSNALWYAIDCRSDIPSMIPNRVIATDRRTKNSLLSYFTIPLNTPLDVNLIHTISGEIEIMLDKCIDDKKQV